MKPSPIFSRGTPRAERGMSLVEILVATAVGLIGVTMIMQVFAVAEGQKRTATGGSDAQVSGNIALFNIERDLRHAGFGMVTNGASMLGCNTLAYDRTRTGTQDFSFTMAPVLITVNAAGNSDTVKVIYGNSFNVVDSSPFSAGAASGANFPLKNAAGLQVGGLVVAHESPKDCVLAEITGFAAGSVNTVEHANGATYTYNDTSGNPVNVTERFNKAGGLGVALSYTSGSKLFSLGRNPVVKTYAVVGDKLMTQTQIPYVVAQDTITAAGAAGTDGLSDAEVATGIVQLKAVYGKDTNSATDPGRAVDAWNTTLPANATEWLQVRAVKVAVLARSGLFEKTAVYTPAGCTGAGCSPPAPAWMHPSDGTTYFTMSNLADGTDWRNYRYRVYQTTVPLRNMIWSNDP